MNLLRFFKRPKRNKISFKEGFDLLLKKFDLVDKVELQNFWHPPQHIFTLFRIVGENEDRDVSLPIDFVEEMKSWIFKCYAARTESILGILPTFEIGSTKTKAEIEKMAKDWEVYCLNYNCD